MNIGRLIAVLRTLLLRGLGSGVSVLFTVMVSRHLVTAEAALFFVLFNASVIGAVCFRWGIDEVVIRRVAAAKAEERESIAGALVTQAHRRVLFWVGIALLIGTALLSPWVSRHLGDMDYPDFSLMVIASGLIACAAAAARVLQGEGKTDAATFYLNICVPVLALLGLLCLVFIGEKISAQQLLWCYLLAAVTMYAAVVPVRYGREILSAFSPKGRGVRADAADLTAANRLGMVVLAQQALGWSAVAIIPIFYGDSAYAGFVVSQKLATLISLLMLAINFTFSSRFAALHAKGELQELWRLVRLSVGAILVASVAILALAWLFMGHILEYARVPQHFGSIVIIMMIGQIAFSMAALFAVVLSMCRREKFLLRAQGLVASLSVIALLVACNFGGISSAAWVFVGSYSTLALLLYSDVAGVAGNGNEQRQRSLMIRVSKQSRFAEIQKFKNDPSSTINGVNFGKVIAPYLYDLSFKAILKRFTFATIFSTSLVVDGEKESGRILIYSCRSKKRSDYDHIIDRNRYGMGPGHLFVEVIDKLNPMQCVRTAAMFLSSFRMAASWSGGFLEKLTVGLLIAKFRSSSTPVLDEVIRGARQLVTFCDAQPTENLASQLGRIAGAVTLTNQHGQYRYLDDQNLSEDAEVYANFVSDYLLCWGEATVAEFAKAGINSERMIVVGWLRSWPQRGSAEKMVVVPGTFGVMLNGENARESNTAMLAIAEALAEQMGMKYLVRLHPWSEASSYSALCGPGCSGLEKLPLFLYQNRVEFSIGHMSGAVVELLCSDQAIYLLDDGKLAGAFNISGLAMKSLVDFRQALAMDKANPEAARLRRARLAAWYNDDSNQEERLRMALSME